MATDRRMERIRQTVAHRQQGVIVLENIESQFNAAAVYRTAEALGFGTVHLIFENVRGFAPKMDGHRAATSAACWLDFHTHDSTQACCDALRAEGYTIIATAVDDQAECVFDATLDEVKIAMVFGNETEGVSATALQMADRTLAIPMRGMMQSLNVSVTASLFMYELTRQRIARGFERYQWPADLQEAMTRRFEVQRNTPSSSGARRKRRRR